VRRRCALLALAGTLALAGCGQLDLTPEGDPGRVATGRVELSDGAALPPGAIVTVRVVDTSVTGMPPEVLGSQTLRDPGAPPIPFRVIYRAEDEVLRHGLNLEARVSIDGKVKYFNMSQYALTLGNAADPHRIIVNPIRP
jgi:putative lipoprotein